MNSKEETTRDSATTSPPSTTTQTENINHNGFTNTPTLAQVIPPVLILITMTTTLVQVHLVLESPITVGIADVLIGADFGVVCWLWWVATGTIVTDEVQLKHL